MKKKTFIVQLLDSKKPSRTSFTQVEDALFYSNDTDASLVFIPHEDTFDFESAKVVMFNLGDESLVERDAEVTTEDGRKVASYELPAEIISHWGEWIAQPVFISGGEIYSGAIVPFSVERHLMHERPPKLTEVVTVTKFVEQSQELVNAMIQAEAQRITEEQVRQSEEAIRVQAENERSSKYESYAQQFNDVITDLSEEKDYHSLPEISAARGGHETLGARLDETTAQLSKKVGLGKKAELEDLSANVLSAIEGGGGTTFNLLSIPQEKSVTPITTTFIDVSSNLYNSATTKALTQLDDNGNEITSTSGNALGDFIKVKPNTTYSVSSPIHTIAYYDEDIGYRIKLNPSENKFTTPDYAEWVRLSMYNESIHNVQMNEGGQLLPYEDYYNILSDEITVAEVMDIRVGIDGTVYETAGEAVRNVLSPYMGNEGDEF